MPDDGSFQEVCLRHTEATIYQPRTLPLEDLSVEAATSVNEVRDLAVAVTVPAWNATYVANADHQYALLSTAKLLIMLAFLDQLDGTPPEDGLALLGPMIQNSDNKTATSIWDHVGGAIGVGNYLNSIGIEADLNSDSWGANVIAPDQPAKLLSMLIRGELLQGRDQIPALGLLENVNTAQDWGLPGNLEKGTFSGVKNGWYPETDGWELNSVGFVIPKESPSYTYAVYSRGWSEPSDGIAAIEAITSAVHRSLASACPPSPY